MSRLSHEQSRIEWARATLTPPSLDPERRLLETVIFAALDDLRRAHTAITKRADAIDRLIAGQPMKNAVARLVAAHVALPRWRLARGFFVPEPNSSLPLFCDLLNKDLKRVQGMAAPWMHLPWNGRQLEAVLEPYYRRKITPEMVEDANDLLARGVSFRETASRLGVKRTALQNAIEKARCSKG